MYGISHVAVIQHVAFVPNGSDRHLSVAGFGMDRTCFCAECPPTAFRLHCPMGGVSSWAAIARSSALRNLVKSVLEGLRTDLDWLKKRVVTRISRHPAAPIR